MSGDYGRQFPAERGGPSGLRVIAVFIVVFGAAAVFAFVSAAHYL